MAGQRLKQPKAVAALSRFAQGIAAPASNCRGIRRLLAAAVTITLASAAVPVAAADEDPGYRALTINTSGQSGHVSTPEFALRTAGADPGFGPHTTDQLPLYTDFRYTDGMLHDGSGTPTTTLPGARIWRDDHVRPAVFGDDLAGAWRGVGYALSEDRMWQHHLFRMAARKRTQCTWTYRALDLAASFRTRTGAAGLRPSNTTLGNRPRCE